MPEADKEDALLVVVMRDGQIYFGTDRIKADELTNKVKDRLADKPISKSLSGRTCGPNTAPWWKWWTTSAPPASTTWDC
jgi:hypothetical protein